ncbi:hypothetical protein ABZX30_19265 [Streptomyces sp. NPDC004542]|uniref:hypothetical protein n=1 Tax=Streptomyces sp. NPDC004542 TaxID=3154281 RepID=UPI0033A2522D
MDHVLFSVYAAALLVCSFGLIAGGAQNSGQSAGKASVKWTCLPTLNPDGPDHGTEEKISSWQPAARADVVPIHSN